MPFLFYFAVLVAALVSVIMGVDIASQPTAKPAIQATAVEPIRHAPSLPPVATEEPAAAVAAPEPATAATVPPASPPRQTVSQSSEESAAPLCNVQACEAAYRSFTAADCTYQPLEGPRRLCAKK